MKNRIKKSLKASNGITLIALVITIIVLLILAGISISMLSGDNSIFNRATQAKNVTGEKQIQEKIRLAYSSALTKDISNQKAQVQKSTFEDELAVEFPNKTISITESADKKEWIVTIDEVTENVPIGKSTPKLADLVEIGDYVTYDATSGDGDGLTIKASDIAEIVQTIDTSTQEKAFAGGATLSGTFTSGDIIKWRVISTKGGIVRIIGELPTTNKVLFSGTEGFRYAEDVLNKISEIYGKGNGATEAKSIVLDDLDLNYDGISGRTELEYTYTNGKFFNQIRKNGKVIGYENTLVEASESNPITMKQDAFATGGSTIFNNAEKMWPMYQKVSAGNGFWIASRQVTLNSNNAYFGLFVGCFGGGLGGTPNSFVFNSGISMISQGAVHRINQQFSSPSRSFSKPYNYRNKKRNRNRR